MYILSKKMIKMNPKRQVVVGMLVLALVLQLTQWGLIADQAMSGRTLTNKTHERAIIIFDAMGALPCHIAVLALAVELLV